MGWRRWWAFRRRTLTYACSGGSSHPSRPQVTTFALAQWEGARRLLLLIEVRGVSSNGAGSSAKGLWSLPSVVCGAWVTERPQLVLEVVGLGEVVAAEQVDVIVDER